MKAVVIPCRVGSNSRKGLYVFSTDTILFLNIFDPQLVGYKGEGPPCGVEHVTPKAAPLQLSAHWKAEASVTSVPMLFSMSRTQPGLMAFVCSFNLPSPE